MMVKSFIDMSRPHLLYAAGLGLIMLLSLISSNVEGVALSSYVEIPFRKQICAFSFLGGSLFGVLAIQRHMARARQPWRVPQSQVAIPYFAFFIATIIGVALSR